MSGNITGSGIKNPKLISRFELLAVEIGCLLSVAIHVAGEVVSKGTLIGKIVGGAEAGKFRAYAEGVVLLGGAFAVNAKTFTLDPTGALVKHFRSRDVITDSAGNALGTIDAFSSVTGVGTLLANSSSVLAVGGIVKVQAASLLITAGNGRLLKNEVRMEDIDGATAAYMEGFFVKSATTLTASAITTMSVVEPSTDEVRITARA